MANKLYFHNGSLHSEVARYPKYLERDYICEGQREEAEINICYLLVK